MKRNGSIHLPVAVKPRRRRTVALALIVSVLIGVLLIEAVVRLGGLGGPIYEFKRTEPNGRVPFGQTREGLLVYLPNSTFSHVYDPTGDDRGYFGPEGRVTYSINEYGMRGRAYAIARGAGDFRVVCLGDSITFGEGVREADSFPARLGAILANDLPDRNVQVMNAGVQGYDTDREALFYYLYARRFKPEVVILEFFLNDASDFGETISQNEAMTKSMALSWPARWFCAWEVVERQRARNQAMEDYFRTTRAGFASSRWTDCRKDLSDLQALSKEDGFRFIVVVFPILWKLDGEYPFEDLHASIADACRASGCERIDLLDDYRGRAAESLWVHPTDHHPNEIAHRIAADRIAETLRHEATKP